MNNLEPGLILPKDKCRENHYVSLLFSYVKFELRLAVIIITIMIFFLASSIILFFPWKNRKV